MTKTEIKKKMEDIEYRRFILACKDFWNPEDWRTDRKWFNEWLHLRDLLGEE